MSAGGGRKAIIAAFFANLGIAIAKFVGFAVTQSSSMLAEAVHSVADTGNQALLLLGGHRARKPATPTHSFGYARERYFWSFVVSLILFTLGSLFAIYEGVEKFRHPHAIQDPEWAFGILGVAIVLVGLSAMGVAMLKTRSGNRAATPITTFTINTAFALSDAMSCSSF